MQRALQIGSETKIEVNNSKSDAENLVDESEMATSFFVRLVPELVV